MTRRKITGAIAGVSGLVVALAGCAAAPSATVTTTMPGVAERMFTLDWTAQPDARGARTLEVQVENRSHWDVRNVQLLVQALDGSGGLVSQRREWLGGEMTIGSRRSVEVRGLPAADQYRVTVWSYDVIERPGDGFGIVVN